MDFNFSEDQDITNFITVPKSNKITSNRSQPKPNPSRSKPAPTEDHNSSEDIGFKDNSTIVEQNSLNIAPVKSNRKAPSAKPEGSFVSSLDPVQPKPRPSTLRNTSSRSTVSKPVVSPISNELKPDEEPELSDIPVQTNRRPKPSSLEPRKPVNSVAPPVVVQKPTIGGQPEPSYVYFIRQINNAKTEKVPFRVGYTTNVAHEREKLEQSALYKMLTYKVVKCIRGDALKVCEDFTSRMSAALIRNSWYNISKEEIDNFVSILCISSDYIICSEAKAK